MVDDQFHIAPTEPPAADRVSIPRRKRAELLNHAAVIFHARIVMVMAPVKIAVTGLAPILR